MSVHSGQFLWKYREASSDLEALHQETGFSYLTLQVCFARGLKTALEIKNFLAPRLENLTNPFTLKGMQEAVDRLVLARETRQKVLIFGDYDVDGTAGAALLSLVFQEFGIDHEVQQPDRFKDGYGLNPAAIERASENQVALVVTVDCGITSFAALLLAQARCLDVIVIDHHHLDSVQGLPPACAVVNPQRPDCSSGLKQLCGCGLAFYLVMALRSVGRKRGWFHEGQEPNLKQHLDLVVIATAADMVPLTGDNHILVKIGMEVLKASRKPGVRALLEVAGIAKKDISPSHLGFVLGPRINASGRLESASFAWELLCTADEERAQTLAQHLETLNLQRVELQNQIWDEVRIRIEQGMAQGLYQRGIVVADPRWHEGVIGIVASRITETFHKPAVVIALKESLGKGSVRSYRGQDVLGILRSCAQELMAFGGHAYAAGLTISIDRVAQFIQSFDEACRAWAGPSGGELWVDQCCEISDLNRKTLEELERLGPFGPGHSEPVCQISGRVQSHQILKERHFKFQLTQGQSASIQTIWFRGAENQETFKVVTSAEDFKWVGVPELNRFRGQTTPHFRIKDWCEI